MPPTEEQPRLSATVARGAGLLGVAYLFTQVISIVAYAVLARLAPPATFGAFAAASILVGAGTLLSESGMTAALVQRAAEIDRAASTATVSTVLGGLFTSVLALAFSPLVGRFFQSQQIGQVAAALSGLMLLNAACVVPSALLQRRMSLRPRLIVEPAAVVVLGATSGLALAAGAGIWGLVLGAYGSAVFRTVSFWVLAGWLPRLRDASWSLWRELAVFARHILASEGLRYTGDIASTAVVGRALGTAALGYFRYGWRMAMTGASLVSVGQYVLLPAFARIADDPLRFREAFERALRVSCFALFPVFAIFLSLGVPITVLLYGEPWAEAGDVLRALSVVAVTAAVGSVAAESLKAGGRPDVLVPATVLVVAIPIPLMFVFLPWGAVGVALAFSVGRVISTSYTITRASFIVGLPLGRTLRAMAAPSVAALGFAVVAWGLEQLLRAEEHSLLAGLALLSVEIVVAGVVYVVLAVLLSRAVAAEVSAVGRVLRERVLERGAAA